MGAGCRVCEPGGHRDHLTADSRYTFYFAPGGFLQTFTPDFTFVNIWSYRNFTDGGPTEDRKFHFTGACHAVRRLAAHGGIFLEHFGYDPQLYQYYYLGHISGSDTTFTHFVGTSQIPNTDCVFALQTPAFASFDFKINYLTCRDENFFEWASANIYSTLITLDWRPTPQFRANSSYNAQYYHRRSDGSARRRRRSSRDSTSSTNSRGRSSSASSGSTTRVPGQPAGRITHRAADLHQGPQHRYHLPGSADDDQYVRGAGAVRLPAGSRHRGVRGVWEQPHRAGVLPFPDAHPSRPTVSS